MFTADEEAKIVVATGIEGPFWAWIKKELDQQCKNAIHTLTDVKVSSDNIGEIAAAQERLRAARIFLKMPYAFLGIPEPR